jgi:xylan 1,4-beta-xylosidase
MGQQTAPVIRNPVLNGSHPDPSMLRVGRDFYRLVAKLGRCLGARGKGAA